jgi:hypothetical protein
LPLRTANVNDPSTRSTDAESISILNAAGLLLSGKPPMPPTCSGFNRALQTTRPDQLTTNLQTHLSP